MLRRISFLSLLLAGVSACLDVTTEELPADEAPAAGDPGVDVTNQAFIDCTEWQCGSNSPVIDALTFHELNVDGLANAQGFSVITMRQGSLLLELSVERGRIIGRSGSTTLAGPALEGAEIWLRRAGSPKTYLIRITDVQVMPMFATLNGALKPIETYLLELNEIGSSGQPLADWRNLCHNPPTRENPDLIGMNAFHAVVFEGERINSTAKTINTFIQPSWFNIGCAGHTLAKLALSGQTYSAQLAHGFTTTIAERQTFLKMLTGDYCGTGKPFTVAGQKLQWQDARDYTHYKLPLINLETEARWTPAGAACLSTPRVDANPTALGAQAFPLGADQAINQVCPNLPPCPFGPSLFDGKYLVSANPK